MAKQVAPIVDGQEMNDHMKAMWAGQSNVLVAVRVRPLMKHDQVKKSCVRVLETNVVVILDPASGDKQDILRANRSKEKQYAFDHVFDPNSSQESCYLHTAKFLIHGVLDGYNATVFAYGQTGSGKTYTMIGTEREPGIMVRVMEDLFRRSAQEGQQQGVQFKITVSFLEVYNENIRDLLSDVEEYLDLREDPIKGPVVASITEIEAASSKEIMNLLHRGNAKRSQAATAANEVSSRSHAVLQVVIESRDRAPGTVANIKVGKLSLVDLAGSERAANTKNRGARLVEGANINRSLLALGNCINALGEKGNKGNFVPYRDSKLTRLLKDSLGGNCRTVMIANISCSEASFEETLNTLKYANRAKNIKTHAQRNVLNVNYHISEYVALINNLRGEIQILKSQISSQDPDPGLLPPGGPVGAGVGLADGPIGLHPSSADGPRRRGSAGGEPLRSPSAGGGARSPLIHPHARGPATPFHALRESLRSGTAGGFSTAGGGGSEARELVNNMRTKIVENFQERMQLRRSLIELEDQNVQNSIEVSKRQLLVVQWSEQHGSVYKQGSEHQAEGLTKADFAADIISNGTPEVVEAWQECEQLRKAIMKNNGMKRNIAKRLRHNEKEAESFRSELGDKITGEDRKELMELQYQVGRLELENMELEQHRIVHESILKGKDLEIQKLKLQLAVRDKLINRQQNVLIENNLDQKVGYAQLALMEQTLMNETEFSKAMVPPSPPRNMAEMLVGGGAVGSSLDREAQRKDTQDALSGGRGNGGHQDKVGAIGRNGVNPGIAAAGRRKKGGADDAAGAAAGGGGGGNRRGLPSVPQLKLADQQRHASALLDSDGEDEDAQQDEYAMPIMSDRETKLTARDRDLIEQGEWSEINSELSDNDNALGPRATPPLNAARNKQPKGSSGGGGKDGGGRGSNVHGPRGGRHFRSPSGTGDDLQAGSQHRPSNGYGNSNGKGNSGEAAFLIEDSDEDSHFGSGGIGGSGGGGGGGGGSLHRKRSPRSRIAPGDRLEPIPALPADDAQHGVLSGRRLQVGGNRAVSDRSNSIASTNSTEPLSFERGDSKDSGFAPVYPMLPSNSGSNKAGAGDPLLRAARAGRQQEGGGGGGAGGGWNDDSALGVVGAGGGVAGICGNLVRNHYNSNNASVDKIPMRRNSKALLEEALPSDAAGSDALELPLAHPGAAGGGGGSGGNYLGEGGGGLVIRSKGLGNKGHSRIKQPKGGVLSGGGLAALDAAAAVGGGGGGFGSGGNENSDFGLNIHGAGIGGGGGGGQAAAQADVPYVASRPSKVKPNNRAFQR